MRVRPISTGGDERQELGAVVTPCVQSGIAIKGVQLSDVGKGLVPQLIRSLVFLLALTVFFPEAKIGLQGLVLVIPFRYQGDPFNRPFLFEIIIILIFALFVVGLAQGEIRWRPTWSTTVVILMIYVALLVIPVSLLLGLEFSDVGLDWLRIIFESFALFLAVSHLTWRARDVRLIIWLFIAAGVFHSTLSILQYYRPDLVPLQVNMITIYNRYMGLFSQASRFAHLLVVAFAMLYSLWQFDEMSPLRVFGYLVLLSILSVGIALSQTRGAMIALVVTLLLMAWYHRVKISRRYLGLITVAFVVMLSLMAADVFSLALTRYQLPLFAHKAVFWAESLQLLLRYPFGMGFTLTGHAENLYLHWANMFGLPGLALLLYFIVRMSCQVIRSLSRRNVTDYAGLSAMWAGLVVFLLSCMSQVALITPEAFWFWLLAGIAISYSGSRKQAKR